MPDSPPSVPDELVDLFCVALDKAAMGGLDEQRNEGRLEDWARAALSAVSEAGYELIRADEAAALRQYQDRGDWLIYRDEYEALVAARARADKLAEAVDAAKQDPTWAALPMLARVNVNRALRVYREDA